MDVNLPKFLAHDIPLFEGIIQDLFPGLTLPKADYSEFLGAVAEVCQKHNLQNVDFFNDKVIQMYEMMIVRHGSVCHGEMMYTDVQKVKFDVTVVVNFHQNN